MTSRGFTLIELLIVVVVIGILAALAIPKFRSTKEKAYVASMKSDLRNFATAQEGYFYDSSAYADKPTLIALGRFAESSGVTVTVSEATGGGWSANAIHAQAPGRTCYLYAGNAAPVGPAGTPEGKLACT